MGQEPTVCHMNEGHAAFMALERVRNLRSHHNMTSLNFINLSY
jgi:starch phosphorylase